MNFAAKYNKTATYYDYQYPESAVYTNLQELAENAKDPQKVYTVHALYISNKGKYGPTPAAAIGQSIICNLPGWLTADIEKMRADEELTQAINAGRFGFRIGSFIRKGESVKRYRPVWVDIEPDLPF